MEKKKIIIFGDDPTGCTGFGKICDHLVDAVLAAGHIPIVVGLKANQNKNYEKAKIYNVLEFSDYQGWKTLGDVLINEKAGMVISIGDPWDIRGIAEIRQKIDFIWIGYVPVDSTPYPWYVLLVQQPQQYLDTAFLLNSMDYIVTFSEFGKNAVNDMLTNAFSESEPALKQRDIQNIYLGVDTRLYCPKDKPKARKVFNGAISSDTLLFSCIKVKRA